MPHDFTLWCSDVSISNKKDASPFYQKEKKKNKIGNKKSRVSTRNSGVNNGGRDRSMHGWVPRRLHWQCWKLAEKLWAHEKIYSENARHRPLDEVMIKNFQTRIKRIQGEMGVCFHVLMIILLLLACFGFVAESGQLPGEEGKRESVLFGTETGIRHLMMAACRFLIFVESFLGWDFLN